MSYVFPAVADVWKFYIPAAGDFWRGAITLTGTGADGRVTVRIDSPSFSSAGYIYAMA